MKERLSPVAAGILDGLNEVLSDLNGTANSNLKKSVVYRVNPKAIREQLNMSQSQFASSFGIPLSTLKNWEQGRREMDATAEAYLKTISMFPEAALTAQR